MSASIILLVPFLYHGGLLFTSCVFSGYISSFFLLFNLGMSSFADCNSDLFFKKFKTCFFFYKDFAIHVVLYSAIYRWVHLLYYLGSHFLFYKNSCKYVSSVLHTNMINWLWQWWRLLIMTQLLSCDFRICKLSPPHLPKQKSRFMMILLLYRYSHLSSQIFYGYTHTQTCYFKL